MTELKVTRRNLLALAAGATDVTTSTAASAPYPRTSAEVAAGVVPTNYNYTTGNVKRYGAAGNGETNDYQAIQNAINSCSSFIYFPSGTYLIGQPLIIGANTFTDMRFVGESRTSTYLAPYSTNLSAAPDDINALIINKKDNGKLSFSHIRFWSGVTYTGIVLYAERDGGGRGDCKVIFSGSMDDCWCDLSSQNAGFFTGGLINYRISNMTWEFMKGIFNFTSTTSDVYFENIVLSSCYDYFVQQRTALGSNIMSVQGLHAYTHKRGVLFKLENCTDWTIVDVNLQASIGSSNSSGIGLFDFNNCKGIVVDTFSCYSNTKFGTGAVDNCIILAATQANFSNGIMDGPKIGIIIQGIGSVDLNFNQVNCVNSLAAALQVVGTKSSPGGLVKAINCNWSDGLGSLVVFVGSASFDFHIDNCRLVNAGLGGEAGTVNFAPATSGLVKASDCVIGRNDRAAAASCYLNAAGSGPALLIDPVFVGTPPTAIQSPSPVQLISIGELSVAYSAHMTLSAATFDKFDITVTDSKAFTINAPMSPMYGRRITVRVINASGGALGPVVWNAAFKMAAWIQPANGFSRSIDFLYNNTAWYEVARTPLDVPN